MGVLVRGPTFTSTTWFKSTKQIDLFQCQFLHQFISLYMYTAFQRPCSANNFTSGEVVDGLWVAVPEVSHRGLGERYTQVLLHVRTLGRLDQSTLDRTQFGFSVRTRVPCKDKGVLSASRPRCHPFCAC